MVVVSAQNNLQGLQGEISLAVPLTFQENKMTLKHPKKKKSLVESCLQLLMMEKGHEMSLHPKPVKKPTPNHLTPIWLPVSEMKEIAVAVTGQQISA